MRRLGFGLMVVCIFGLVADVVVADEAAKRKPKIKWHKDALAGIRLGIDQKKPIVLYFGERWCKWCVKLEDEVFPSPEVQALADEAVFVFCEPSKSEINKAAVKDLGIKNYPTVLIYGHDAKGVKKLGTISGHFKAAEFADLLRKMLGLEKPKSKTAPIVKLGPSLSDSSNLCPPGDEWCRELLKKPSTGNSILDLDLGVLTAPKKGEAKPAVKSLSHDEIRGLLTELGFKPEPREDQRYVIRKKDKQLEYAFYVLRSSSGRVIYLTQALSREVPLDDVPTKLLTQILTRNSMIGPVFFEVTEGGQLRLSVSVLNNPATKQDLQFAIDKLSEVVGQEAELWKQYAKIGKSQSVQKKK